MFSLFDQCYTRPGVAVIDQYSYTIALLVSAVYVKVARRCLTRSITVYCIFRRDYKITLHPISMIACPLYTFIDTTSTRSKYMYYTSPIIAYPLMRSLV